MIVKLILSFCVVFLWVIYIFAYKFIFLGKDNIASTSVLLNLSYCLSSRSFMFQVQNRRIFLEYLLVHRSSNKLHIPIGYILRKHCKVCDFVCPSLCVCIYSWSLIYVFPKWIALPKIYVGWFVLTFF